MTLTLLVLLLAGITVTVAIINNINKLAAYERFTNSQLRPSRPAMELKQVADKSTKIAFASVGFVVFAFILMFAEILGYIRPVIIW